jgi:hypothetical protein
MGIIQKEYLMILNICSLNVSTPNFITENRKGQIDSDKMIVGNFNITFSSINKTSS